MPGKSNARKLLTLKETKNKRKRAITLSKD